ncbi:hypothetical protein BT69DRAFT_1304599 [Atractiella rhizophila]|nr:hypothetical protein BT69DRAFT_1304599 [Atractiella rhizophila]
MGGVSSRERTGTWIYIAAQRIVGKGHHQLLDDFESIYHVLSVFTFAHINEDEIPELGSKIEGYLSRTSAESKKADITGQADGFEDDVVLEIPIFGPIIVLFRLFLSPRYMRRAVIAHQCCNALNLANRNEARVLTSFLQHPTEEETQEELSTISGGGKIFQRQIKA